MKKILIYSHVANWEMHHSQVIELAWKNHVIGNRIYLLHCLGDLVSCPQNPHHDLGQCRNCISTTKRTVKLNLPPGVNNIYLNFKMESLNEIALLDSYTNQEELKFFSFNDIPFGQMVLNQLVDDQQDIVLDKTYLKLNARRLLDNSLKLYQSTLKTLGEYEIDHVYVWNGRRSSDSPIIYAAKELGLNYSCFISGSEPNRIWILNDFIHSIKANNEDLNRVVKLGLASADRSVITKKAKEVFDSFESGTNEIPGIRFFGSKWKDNLINNQLNKESKRRLVLFTSSLWEFYSTYSNKTVPEDFSDPYYSLMEICNDDFILQNFEIVVRWHPNLSTAGIGEQELLKNTVIKTPCVIHLLPESPINSYQLIDNSDVIVTFGSTIGIEAAYRGKISILLGASTYQGIGAVFEPRSYIEFIEMLKKTDLVPLSISRSEDWAFWIGTLGSEFDFVKFKKGRGFFLNGLRISTPNSFFGKFREAIILIFNKLRFRTFN